MNISNDSSQGIDYLHYFTTQLPQDLARLASLRDELEKRQGALSAVEDSARMRAEAVQILSAAKEEADALKADTKAKNADVTSKKKLLDAREEALIARESSFDVEYAAKIQNIESRYAAVAQSEANALSRDNALTEKEAALKAEQIALDVKVKALQDKVAALSI